VDIQPSAPGALTDPVDQLSGKPLTGRQGIPAWRPGILSPDGFLLGNDFRSWYHSFQAQVIKL
jgi:hypothetical protein